jgi:hypothetical protein
VFSQFQRGRVRARTARFALAAIVALAGPHARSSSPVSCPAHDPVPFCDIEDIAPPTGVRQLIYAPDLNLLLARNAASAIATIDLNSGTSTLHFSNVGFVDMAISPDHRHVFAADYGGETFQYMPQWASYVHRLDLPTRSWETKSAFAAFRIQAVADDQFILETNDGWSRFVDDAWGSGTSVLPMNTPTDPLWGPAYQALVSGGNICYAPGSARILHGNSNDSSNEIQAFLLSNHEFIKQEGTGGYGSAQGYGGTDVLATDESGFYYGKLKVDPLDVTRTLQTFPENIVAATGDIAFGDGNYYDAHTGQLIGSLGFPTTVYGLNPVGSDFWVFDSRQNLLRHFVINDGIFADEFGG